MTNDEPFLRMPAHRPISDCSVDMMAAGRYPQLASWVESFQYKPGWVFTFYLGALLDVPHMGIYFRALDSTAFRMTPPGQDVVMQRIKVGRGFEIPPYVRGEHSYFIEWVANCIRELELHESAEWFQDRYGVPFNDPHAGDSSGQGSG